MFSTLSSQTAFALAGSNQKCFMLRPVELSKTLLNYICTTN